MDISETIRNIRRACLLSQLDFSKEIGVSFSTVNRWENNRAMPNYQALKKIKDFCEKKGIPFDLDKKIWEEAK